MWRLSLVISKPIYPVILLLVNILSRWNIDKKNSYMIGDSKSDELCAKKTNIKFIYESENYSKIINNYF